MARYQRYESREQVKTEKSDIRKMMKYTAKKILWVTNYSLSFSVRNTRKEILIKLLGCAVILQSLSLIVSFSLNTTRIFLANPVSAFALLFLTLAALFKKEIISLFKKREWKAENVLKNDRQTGVKK